MRFLSVQVNAMVTHSQLPTLVIGYYAKCKQKVMGYSKPLCVRCEYANCYENKWAYKYASTQSKYTTLHGYLIECGLVHLI